MSEVMRQGDRTSTGGVVVQGNGTVQHQGKAVASIGMEATCPACKKGRGPIVPVGPRTVYLPDGPAALAGDYVACGCPPKSNVLIAAHGHASAGAVGRGASSVATMAAGLASGAGGSTSRSGNAEAASGAVSSSASTNTGAWPASAMPSSTGPLSRGGPSDPCADGNAPSGHAEAVLDETQQPTRVVTGLGEDVDNLVIESPWLLWAVSKLQREGWTFRYGPKGGGSYTQKAEKTITLDGKYEGMWLDPVKVLAHEAGHGVYPLPNDVSSKQAFVEEKLREEAFAVIANVRVRRELLDYNAYFDIGAPNFTGLGALFNRYEAGEHEALDELARVLAKEGHANTTGEGAVTYYGDQYDNLFGGPPLDGVNIGYRTPLGIPTWSLY